MIRHFRDDPYGHSGRRLPELPDIQTFVMRGAWNIMRDYRHWSTLSDALPNVRAVYSLRLHAALNFMRIRFIDLDSACPLLNPYFQLHNNQCTGLWSEDILETLHETRPQAQFVELNDGIYPQYGPNHQIIGAVYPRSRPLSIHASTYQIIADVSKPN
ncbi:hypothetical protein ATERTT37_000443 [Aspergillus terreus]